MKYLAIIFYLILLIGCTETKTTMCPDMRPECIVDLLKNHPIRDPDYWSNFFKRSPEKRIYVADEKLIDFIDLDNKRERIPNIPSEAKFDQGFLKDVQDALNEIPSSVWSLVDKKFAGVFLLAGLGGTGLTDYIYDKSGKQVGGFIVLDVDVLQSRTANQWATWKESTPFKTDSEYTIEAIIASPAEDNRKSAIQYIFLHELAHIQSVMESYHPSWVVQPKELKGLDSYPFSSESWLVDQHNNKFRSKYDDAIFPQRDKVVYYFGAQLSGDQMLPVYDNLEKTNFVTLYAATIPGDDWAESFVTYVHNQLMHKPFQINVKKKGKTVKNFSLCWDKLRCEKKKKFLKQLF